MYANVWVLASSGILFKIKLVLILILYYLIKLFVFQTMFCCIDNQDRLIHFCSFLLKLCWIQSCNNIYCTLAICFFNRAGSLNLDTCGANSQPLVLRIRKWDLDDAHKDKANKFYSPDFKVKSSVRYSVFYVCNYYMFAMVENM